MISAIAKIANHTARGIYTFLLWRGGISNRKELLEAGYSSSVLADKELHEKIKRAEQQAELFYIAKVREATQKPNGWRAAAWWLERRLPEAFGFSKPEQITHDKIEKFMIQFLEIIFQYVTKTNEQKELYERMKMLAESL
jgi:hypothetical protein